jgi:hypothetical protein
VFWKVDMQKLWVVNGDVSTWTWFPHGFPVSREEIVSACLQPMAEIDRICFPFEFLSCQIRKLLCENSQEGLAEHFWRGN